MDQVVNQSYRLFHFLHNNYPAIEAFVTFKTQYVREVAIGKFVTKFHYSTPLTRSNPLLYMF